MIEINSLDEHGSLIERIEFNEVFDFVNFAMQEDSSYELHEIKSNDPEVRLEWLRALMSVGMYRLFRRNGRVILKDLIKDQEVVFERGENEDAEDVYDRLIELVSSAGSEDEKNLEIVDSVGETLYLNLSYKPVLC